MTNVSGVGPPASARDSSGLTILGASARAAAQSAQRAGLRPFAADLFADTDLQACCPSVRLARYPDDFPAILGSAAAGPWIYTGGLENHPQLIEQLAALCPLYGNGAGTLGRVRDPWQIAAGLDRHGLARPELAAEPDQLPVDGTWLRKGRRSAGGLQVSAWLGEDRATDDAPSQRSGEYYFQRRVAGLSCSAVYVAAGGQAVLAGVSEQLLGRDWASTGQHKSLPANTGDFRYAGSIGPLPLDEAMRDQIRRIGQVLAAEFQLVGLFGVDCILAGGVPWPVEVNPRYTASIEIIERALGLPLIGCHVDACSSGRLPKLPDTAPGQFWGKAILPARHDLVVGISLTDYVAATPPIGSFPLLADIPAAGSQISAGQPILTVFARGESQEGVRAGLRSRLKATEDVILSTG